MAITTTVATWNLSSEAVRTLIASAVPEETSQATTEAINDCSYSFMAVSTFLIQYRVLKKNSMGLVLQELAYYGNLLLLQQHGRRLHVLSLAPASAAIQAANTKY